jgi:hypothetical protein
MPWAPAPAGSARGGGAVDRFGQVALAGPERRLRKGQRLQRPVAGLAVAGLLPRPAQEGLAALRQHVLQFVGTEDLPQFDLGLARDIDVHQRQRDLGQLAGAAEQRAVGLQLRPVQLPAVLGDLVRVPADGLDLFQAAPPRVVAVGTAAHAQRAAGGFQRDLGLVVLAASLRHRGLAHAALRARWPPA